jgi:hypothetical protein
LRTPRGGVGGGTRSNPHRIKGRINVRLMCLAQVSINREGTGVGSEYLNQTLHLVKGIQEHVQGLTHKAPVGKRRGYAVHRQFAALTLRAPLCRPYR